jgi:dihydrofolate reductase
LRPTLHTFLTIDVWSERAGAVLLGRKTYEIFNSYWPDITDPADPIASRLNVLANYVASTRLSLGGLAQLHAPERRRRDRGRQSSRNSRVASSRSQDSGDLANTLIEHGLVEEYRLLIYPVHLGAGKKALRRRREGGGAPPDRQLGHEYGRDHRDPRAGGPRTLR